jgi:hypothetical protein
MKRDENGREADEQRGEVAFNTGKLLVIRYIIHLSVKKTDILEVKACIRFHNTERNTNLISFLKNF